MPDHDREQTASGDSVQQRDSAETRDHALSMREARVRDREVAVEARSERQLAFEQMRDVSEQLLIASVRAQDAADAASAAQAVAEEVGRALKLEALYRERLMAILSHDLRNPLMGITMSAEMLKALPDVTGMVGRLSDRIHTSAARMRELIDAVLEFTRARHGGIALNLRKADLGEICRMVVDELRAGRGARATFALHLDGDLAGQWDAGRLAQVVSNLCGNAVQHGDLSRPIVLRASGTPRSVTLSIRNSGAPIPADLLPHLFEAFQRGRHDRGRQLKDGGLGLGLYISDQLVRSHGGRISVESSEGGGTTFSFELPRAASNQETAVPPEDEEPADRTVR